jgi:hypothetical protein
LAPSPYATSVLTPWLLAGQSRYPGQSSAHITRNWEADLACNTPVTLFWGSDERLRGYSSTEHCDMLLLASALLTVARVEPTKKLLSPLRKPRSIRLCRKVAVRPTTQLLSAISVHCGAVVYSRRMTRHDRVSSAAPAGPRMSNEARARVHNAGFLDLGTLPSMKHRKSRPLAYQRGGQAFHIWHAILGNGTAIRVCEDRVPWHRDQGCGDGLVNSWRDHYD